MHIIKTATSVSIEVTATEEQILANDLLDPMQHFVTVATEKLANCKSRLLTAWTAKLLQDKSVPSIPTDEQALLDLIFSHPDYKNRKQREADSPLPHP